MKKVGKGEKEGKRKKEREVQKFGEVFARNTRSKEPSKAPRARLITSW